MINWKFVDTNHIAQYIPKITHYAGNHAVAILVISMINYMELGNFLIHITLNNAYLQSHAMLVTGNLVTSIINYIYIELEWNDLSSDQTLAIDLEQFNLYHNICII